MLRVSPRLVIDEHELEEHFVLAGGPGGQNVNKTATAVQLRFDVLHSASLSWPVRQRLMKLAGRRLTKDGVLVIAAHRHRSQAANRRDARERLAELVRSAAITPKARRKTQVSRAAKTRRLEAKRSRGALKRQRTAPGNNDAWG